MGDERVHSAQPFSILTNKYFPLGIHTLTSASKGFTPTTLITRIPTLSTLPVHGGVPEVIPM